MLGFVVWGFGVYARGKGVGNSSGPLMPAIVLYTATAPPATTTFFLIGYGYAPLYTDNITTDLLGLDGCAPCASRGQHVHRVL